MLKFANAVHRTVLRQHVSQISCYSTAPLLIKVEKVGKNKNVALVTLNRRRAFNALSPQLMKELISSLKELDRDESVGAIVITGNQKVFSAGADIKEMSELTTFPNIYVNGFPSNWKQISEVGKPLIAAVNGYVFGGGCELVMMCDIIYAGEKAQFSQPEINIGTIPGAGGTQRWTRVAGKSMAMEVCLTGVRVSAEDAKNCGLISKVFPVEEVVGEAVKLGEKISEQSPLIIRMCKEAVNSAYETTLKQGLQYERRLFHSTFATKDRKEGMTAFLEKRSPKWSSQ